MNKIIFCILIVSWTFAVAQSGIFKGLVDDAIYGAIHVVLKNQFPHDLNKTDCMIKSMRQKKIADKFYTPDLLIDSDRLAREVQPYIKDANTECSIDADQYKLFKNFVDHTIYGSIDTVLKEKYPNETNKTECMLAYLKQNEVARNLYASDLLLDTDKLSKEAQPYIDDANTECSYAEARNGIFKGIVDDAIYRGFRVVIKNKYPDEAGKTDCMINFMKEKKVVDKFYTTDLLLDLDKLTRESSPYIDEARAAC